MYGASRKRIPRAISKLPAGAPPSAAAGAFSDNKVYDQDSIYY
jgi:hypothetical protein